MPSQPESSRASEQPRPWVALSSIPVVIGDDDQLASKFVPGVADLRLSIVAPQAGVSYLMLPERIVPDYWELVVLAACASQLLIMAAPRVDRDHDDGVAYFLADAHARTVARIPDAPVDLGYNLVPRRSIGLIEDPRSPGSFLVAQLQPTSSTTRYDSLLCYAAATGKWTLKELVMTQDHPRWDANGGVLPHRDNLWWIDTAYGMLACYPFENYFVRLHFVPLPLGCQMTEMDDRDGRAVDMDDTRLIRCSNGELRYVQIRGSAYDLYTLVDPDRGPDHWTLDYTVDFADIAGLPRGLVPKLALVDPNNASIIYFFQETSLFSHEEAKEVRACKECVIDATHQDLKFQSSRYIDACELLFDLDVDVQSSLHVRRRIVARIRQAEVQGAPRVAQALSSSSKAPECSRARACEQSELPPKLLDDDDVDDWVEPKIYWDLPTYLRHDDDTSSDDKEGWDRVAALVLQMNIRSQPDDISGPYLLAPVTKLVLKLLTEGLFRCPTLGAKVA